MRSEEGVDFALVENAKVMSYASDLVANGSISRQTVMNKIRSSHAVCPPVIVRQVPVIHIDADEDHVSLQTGKNTIVPLISCYEGVARYGKRWKCITANTEYGSNIAVPRELKPTICLTCSTYEPNLKNPTAT